MPLREAETSRRAKLWNSWLKIENLVRFVHNMGPWFFIAHFSTLVLIWTSSAYWLLTDNIGRFPSLLECWSPCCIQCHQLQTWAHPRGAFALADLTASLGHQTRWGLLEWTKMRFTVGVHFTQLAKSQNAVPPLCLQQMNAKYQLPLPNMQSVKHNNILCLPLSVSQY